MSIKVMSRVWELSQHRGNTLLTLLALADYANDDGVCWPKLDRLSQRARTKERQLQDILNVLDASGELYVQRGQGRGHQSMYVVLTGQDEETIAAILTSYFDLSPLEAQVIAQEKVQKTAPFLQKAQDSAKKGAVLGPKKVRFSAENGAVFRKEKVRFSANQRAIKRTPMPQTDSVPSLRSVIDPPNEPSVDPPPVAAAVGDTSVDLAALFKRIGLE